jgi:fucose permease
MVTVLAGPLLPVLASRWGLRDVQSGAFFGAQFAFSTVGAILAPYRLRRKLPIGYALIGCGVFLLYLSSVVTAHTSGLAIGLTAFCLIGLGIGFSVTATNLLVGSEIAAGRARQLSIVNLSWGAGAVLCPWIVAIAERAGYRRPFLLLMALAAITIFAMLQPMLRAPEPASSNRLAAPTFNLRLLGFFALFLFLYVGTENAIGGWITTYAQRFSGMTLEDATALASLYWLALLAGRAIASLALSFLSERTVLSFALLAALAALVVLLESRSSHSALIAVAIAGAGFGPVFPIGVSRMMGRGPDSHGTGWVFATSASGGALLPWLTGLFSTHAGSLRIGFLVPFVSLSVTFIMALLQNRALGYPVQSLVAQG